MGWDLHETGERWPDNCQLATETAPRTATHVSPNSLLLRLWFAYSTRAEVATQGTPGSNFRPAQNGWGGGRHTGICASAQKRHMVTSVVHVERAAWRELPTGWCKCARIP